MKIKPEHYQHVRDALAPFAPKIADHRQFLIQEGKSKDIDKRLRWDMMYAAKLSQWVCDNLYSYMDDTHIDTALRSIVREFEA